MSVVTAIVPTENANRYLQQLCKHWSHKMDVTFTPDEGRIDFPNGAILALEPAPMASHYGLKFRQRTNWDGCKKSYRPIWIVLHSVKHHCGSTGRAADQGTGLGRGGPPPSLRWRTMRR